MTKTELQEIADAILSRHMSIHNEAFSIEREQIVAFLKEVYLAGGRSMREEAIEWCMAFRRDDGTSQKIEEKLRLIPDWPEGE